jgi:hypothetical protein
MILPFVVGKFICLSEALAHFRRLEMSRFALRIVFCALVVMGLIGGVIDNSALPINSLSSAPAVVVAIQPLDRVPADAAVVVHFEAEDLWNHEVIAAFRKANPEFVRDLLDEPIKNIGMEPENVTSVTLHFPKMPTASGDENLFILQVTTKNP